MKKRLLVTDSFFVAEEHIQRLEAAGYEITHLDKECASEEELIEALKGVSVYILGGTEQVTEKVIKSAPQLKAIIFTGVDYDNFIPAAELAREKGIKLLNAPGANAVAVAEFAVGMALAMLRELFVIGRAGDKKDVTTSTFQGARIGLIGGGHIGQIIAEAIQAFRPSEVIYYNRSSKEFPARQVKLDELVETADIIFVALPKSAGLVLDAGKINKIRPGCLIVSISPMNLIDFKALLPRLQKGEVRCAVDWMAPSPDYNNLPLNIWFHVNSHSGYNTRPAIEAVGDSVTETAILLS